MFEHLLYVHSFFWVTHQDSFDEVFRFRWDCHILKINKNVPETHTCTAWFSPKSHFHLWTGKATCRTTWRNWWLQWPRSPLRKSGRKDLTRSQVPSSSVSHKHWFSSHRRIRVWWLRRNHPPWFACYRRGRCWPVWDRGGLSDFGACTRLLWWFGWWTFWHLWD